jgi:hypothetical protein
LIGSAEDTTPAQTKANKAKKTGKAENADKTGKRLTRTRGRASEALAAIHTRAQCSASTYFMLGFSSTR